MTTISKRDAMKMVADIRNAKVSGYAIAGRTGVLGQGALNESIVGLGKSDVVALAPDVDQRVSMIAFGAQEEAALGVDLGRDGSEHDFEATGPALPHVLAPSRSGNRTAPAAAPTVPPSLIQSFRDAGFDVVELPSAIVNFGSAA